MPIYEYLCEGCGRITEVMQKLSDPPPRTCAECGSRKIAKLVSRTSFQLKGGGWYSDLYASKKAAKPGGATSGAGSDTAPSGKASPSGGAAEAGAEKPAPASPAKTESAPSATTAPQPAKRARGGSGD